MTLEEIRTQELDRLHRYQEVFGSPHGKKVLEDLRARWLYPMKGKEHAAAGNALGVAYVDAQRELILTIQNWVECDAVARVDTLYPEQEKEPVHGESEPYRGTEWFTGD